MSEFKSVNLLEELLDTKTPEEIDKEWQDALEEAGWVEEEITLEELLASFEYQGD